MGYFLVTGSTDGQGLATAQALQNAGHRVILHARSLERGAQLTRRQGPLVEQAAGLVIGDLASATATRALADTLAARGPLDGVIHNAGTYGGPTKKTTSEGHAETLAVNTLAPYLLTALLPRPPRLIYVSSGMHRGAASSLTDMDWQQRPWQQETAYSESKLYLTALAFALARRWPGLSSHAVDPGWVPTKMGGPHAPDDLSLGHQTQVWLATRPEAPGGSSAYWHHQQEIPPAPCTRDADFQDQLLERLAAMTGVGLWKA